MLELLADRPNQDRTQDLPPRQTPIGRPGTAIFAPDAAELYNFGQLPEKPALDVQIVKAENDAVIAPAEPSVTESATSTILIVDDDRSVADTFARMLKLEGFEVATALSAEAGLELADSVRPDAIILDMRMPITNGLQFLRLVRAKSRLATSRSPSSPATTSCPSQSSTSSSRSARRSGSSRCGSRI